MKTFLILILTIQVNAYARDTSNIFNRAFDKLFSKAHIKADANEFDFGAIKKLFLTQSSDFKCSDIDLRNETLGPSRYQGKVGWCFAYATADVATFKLDTKVSASNLAFMFYGNLQPDVKDIKISVLSGGDDQGALNYSKEQLCLEEDMPSDNFSVPSCQFNTQDINEVLTFIDKKLQSNTAYSTCDKKIFNTLFPNLTLDEMNSISSDQQTSVYKKMLSLNDLNCRYKKIRAPYLSLKKGMKSAPNIINEVDEQLEKNNPVVINYNAQFLITDADNKIFYNHYSSIFGRRLNKETNKCEYLIRNTWGTDCSIYPQELQKNCEAGSIWIEKDLINKNLISISFM